MLSRFCSLCGSDIGADDEFCRNCGHAQRYHGEIFFPVSPTKFVLMNLVTFSLYSYYWAYRCWNYAARVSARRISPTWRSALLSLFAFSLFNHVDAEKARAQRRDGKGRVEPESEARVPINLALAVAFFLLTAANSLPDPYSILGVFAFAPLLPSLGEINRLNRQQGDYYRRNSRFGILKGAFVVVMLPIIALMSANTLGLLGSGDLGGANSLMAWDQRMLSQYSGLKFGSDGSPCLAGVPAGLDSIFRLPNMSGTPASQPAQTGAGHLRLAQSGAVGTPPGFQRAPGAATSSGAAKTAGSGCPNP